MVIVARSQIICIIAKPVVAQALIALNAVKISRYLGLPSILLKGNSLQVVTVVKDTSLNWDIKIVIQGLKDWQICHANRINNYAAPCLANNMTSRVIERV
jgi:hypothetical protein